MRVKFSASIFFKTALLITLLEIAALTGLGIISTYRFQDEARNRTINQIQLPGKLMAGGFLDLRSIADDKIMIEIIGEKISDGMVIGTNGKVYYAMNTDRLGQVITEIYGVNPDLFSLDSPKNTVQFSGDYVESSTPVFASDGITPHFFVYIKSDTAELNRAISDFILWFFLISIILVALTSAAIFVLFYKMIIRRITATIGVLKTAENGDLSAEITDIKPLDEIATLQYAVNKLIARRKTAEEEQQETITEKELLLKEFFHRTKNNLQVVASMMALQKECGQSESSYYDIFQEVENRIMAMAMIHEKLYQSNNLSTLSLDEYTRDLVYLIQHGYTEPGKSIRVELELQPVEVLLDIASPLGLALNEILTNAYKHAFTGMDEGSINIAMKVEADERLFIQVKDNGKGLPPEYNLDDLSNFGLKTICSLIEHQLQGDMQVESKGGVSYRMQIPLNIYNKRV